MSKDSVKTWDNLADTYDMMTANKSEDSYEYEINFPSILKMIPDTEGLLLDVGTGSGHFVPSLAKRGLTVDGSDASPKMIELAQQNYPEYNFFVWDIDSPFPSKRVYDVVVSKLALMFMKDLNSAAQAFYKILKPEGTLILSVIHPTYWFYYYLCRIHGLEADTDTIDLSQGYFSTGSLVRKTIANNESLKVEFIHRTVTDYIEPFLQNDFTLTAIDEPRLTESFLQTTPRFQDRKTVPIRLNLRLKRI